MVNGLEVRSIVDKLFYKEHGREPIFNNILDFIEYAVDNFSLSSNGDDRRVTEEAVSLFQKIQKESHGKLPLRIGGEYILDKTDIGNAPIRLTDSPWGINLIYLPNRDNGAWNNKIDKLREDLMKLSQGIKDVK